ncbi:hypothetical protein HF995_10540 [Sanguibacter hominis ATCC BAA-789]|uniref:FtsK domain-containing protein n=1 Tax=Sanguibacter hominis ATCC BAA-789 TaxID=1312740 RepID=A0A9X5FCL2_9MICO|nr:hypothetical protein [Sanguibacter hominis ATCC BAA-789]
MPRSPLSPIGRPAPPRSGPSPSYVRLTFAPDEDVEVRAGIRLADLRPTLARTLGRSDLLHVPLRCGATPLDADALTGHAPLLDGARIEASGTDARRGPHRLGPVDLARRTRDDALVWHVVDGPHAGLVLAADALPTVLGGPRLRAAPGPRGMTVRRRPTLPRENARTVRIRTARGRVRRWSGRPLLLRPGCALVWQADGASHVAVVTSRVPATDPNRQGPPWALLVAPALTGLALATMTGRPAYALLALAGPLTLGLQSLVRSRSATQPPALSGRAQPAGSSGGGLPEARTDGTQGASEPRPGGGHVDLGGVDWTSLRDRPATLLDALLRTPGDGGARGTAASTAPRATAATGPGAERRARAHVCAWAAAHPHGRVVVATADAASAWSWCRWVPGATITRPDVLVTGASPLDGEDLALVVVRVGDLDDGVLSRWWAGAPPTASLLLVADEPDVPAWCADRVGGPGVDVPWADDVARHLASRAVAGGALPAVVPLAALLGLPATSDQGAVAHAVAHRWSVPPSGLRTPLGLAASRVGPPEVLELDLTRDGPHGLVAGTTGAGKSELLQTLVCGLALTHPPSDLAMALVDYKGGASFGACAGLPHVVGIVTDLERGLAARALTGLQAEMRRREALFAASGATTLDEHRALARPGDELVPRLLVVVDEFRSMTQDLPDFVPSLLRLAAQGRSLGMHLVLATQRPGGAVNADMRANLGLRVALRVNDPAESRDVVDTPQAADLPAHAPGRAVVVTSRSGARTVQVAHAASAAPVDTPDARRIPAWGTRTARALGLHTSPDDVLRGLVTAARAAAEATGQARPRRPWLPGLPARVTLGDVEGVSDPRPGLAVALADVPAEQRRTLVRWDPARDGHLVVEGGPGSGRSSALRLLGLAALARGWHVHTLGEVLAGTPAPGLGTVVDARDPRRAADLLDRLARARDAHPTLLLVDDLETVLAALALVDRGVGPDLLVALARSTVVHLALASARALPGTLLAHVGSRVVLGDRSKAADVARGVPTALAGLGGPPGRAVWFGPDGPLLAQVLLPGTGPRTNPAVAPLGGPALVDGSPDLGASHDHAALARAGDTVARTPPLRLAPVPGRVRRRDLDDALAAWRDREGRPAPGPWHLPVGMGGDDGGVRFLDVGRGALVVGPPGAGRSTAAAHLAGLLVARHGAGRVVTVALDGPLAASGAAHHAVDGSPSDLVRLAAEIEEAASAGEAQDLVVVVDDVPLLAQSAPVELERLLAVPAVTRAILTATTGAALGAVRGPLATARARRTGIVLDPGRPGSVDVLGSPLGRATEPGPGAPGRGALVHGRLVEPVQLVEP